ncbi:BPI fold-containing family B member 1 [Nycticebus coucang]|uniref:BPI fold-containing family B member 1 n=1 Tax=Nycticebus coucang TaxID=9470 RepID=UPI00234DA65B|nr:BPI fold-containing family B member 1 [Nycticebus coucang]XP_053430580.1 BPI fold-containing family B member 1 [Nycticebus coucang]XP_053430581.1 BPI fold-containing family B member 1 [Nycticebus coucang]
MASLWTFTLLCGLLTDTLVQATLSPPVVLNLGPEVIKEKLTQELKDHGATAILQQLPLLRAMKEKPAGGIPVLGSLLKTVLNKIIWLNVTSANILQMQVQASAANQELKVNIPLDMVAGFNTPLVKTIVKLQMETEIQAVIRVETSKEGPTRHVLSDCSTSPGSLRLTLLYKLSFLVNALADKVIQLLAPALPQLVKSQLCPVIELAFNDMYADLLQMVKVPISLSPDRLEFDLLSPAIKDDAIQFNLVAKLLDSKGMINKYFNNSMASLTMPTLDNTQFSLIIRQDVVNAVVAALIPPQEIIILLDYVLPELAHQLKAGIRVIDEKAAEQLGPTQIVKIRTQETPKLLLSQGSAKVAQLIVLEVFATNEALHPLFTLGIEASSEAQFYTKGDLLMLNFNNLRCDRIQLMNWAISWFETEPLRNIITEILLSTLLPNQNGKLRPGVPVSIVKDLGFEAASCSLIKNALVVTPASSQTLSSPVSQ